MITQATFRQFADLLPEPMLLTGIDGEIRSLNRAARSALFPPSPAGRRAGAQDSGSSQEIWLGDAGRRSPDADLPTLTPQPGRTRSQLQSIARSNRPKVDILEILKGDGSVRRFRCEGRRLPEAASATFDCFGSNQPVLFLRLSETERTGIGPATLQATVNRLNAAHRHEIRQLRTLAAEAAVSRTESQAKSSFIAGLSHELRSPLNAIIGFASLLEQVGADPEKSADYARTIQQAGDHLLTLVSDLLDLSKIESGHYRLEEEPIDLADLVASCVRIAAAPPSHGGGNSTSGDSSPDDSRGASVEVAIPQPFPTLRADPRALRQVLINLIGNARKFTPLEGLIRVSAWQQPDGSLAISVADTGCGVDPSEIPGILSAYGQTVSERTRGAGRGTGLGLPISRQLVELHGGSFVFDSAPSRGTTVTLTLPGNSIPD